MTRALLLLSIVGAAHAQLPVTVTSEEVVGAVQAAQREVLASAPVLASAAVQSVLREAAATRGVAVFVLVERAWQGDSYAPSLALSGAVAVQETPTALPTLLVIDRETLVEGPLAARAAGPLDAPTYAYRDAAVAHERVRAFHAAWTQGTPVVVDEESIGALLGVP